MATRANRWRVIGWGGAAGLLLLPMIGMQLSKDVNWSAFDFLLAGAMLAIAGLAIELLVSQSGSMVYRLGALLTVGAAFMLIWVNLAVGFLGSENNAANLVFVGVLAVVIVGAALSRLRADGMARTTLTAAVVQLLIGLAAIPAGWAPSDPHGVYEVAMGTTLFTVLWLASALLFRRANRHTSERVALG